MQESSKSIQTMPEVYEDPRLMREYIKLLEERVSALEGQVKGMSIMYKPPGESKHKRLAEYLDVLDNRVMTLEIRQELDI